MSSRHPRNAAGQIRANDLRPDIGGRQIEVHTFPRVVPAGIGEEARQRFRIKVALAFEVAVESPAREAGIGHNPVDGYTLESIPVEKLARAANDLLSDFLTVAGWIRHRLLLNGFGTGFYRETCFARLPEYDLDHILTACSNARAPLANATAGAIEQKN